MSPSIVKNIYSLLLQLVPPLQYLPGIATPTTTTGILLVSKSTHHVQRMRTCPTLAQGMCRHMLQPARAEGPINQQPEALPVTLRQ